MKHSLRAKTAFLIIAMTVILGTASILISSQALRDVVDDSYRTRARDVANTTAVVCLVNPMGQADWWAILYGIAKSQTVLNN